jgi:hypothetical protein
VYVAVDGGEVDGAPDGGEFGALVGLFAFA